MTTTAQVDLLLLLWLSASTIVNLHHFSIYIHLILILICDGEIYQNDDNEKEPSQIAKSSKYSCQEIINKNLRSISETNQLLGASHWQ